MEKHDYVICSWCEADDVPYFEYHYLYDTTHNEAVYEARFNSNQQTLYNHKDLIYNELDKRFGNDKFIVTEFADVYEEILNEFQRFKVWQVLSGIPKEAYSEYDFSPELFCNHWCERVA